MKFARILAVVSGVIALIAFFSPILTLNGEPVMLYRTGYFASFAFVVSGVIAALLGIQNKTKHMFWPTLGMMVSGITFTNQLKASLNEHIASYDRIRAMLQDQAAALGLDVGASSDMTVAWEFGMSLAMAAYIVAILAYGIASFPRSRSKKV